MTPSERALLDAWRVREAAEVALDATFLPPKPCDRGCGAVFHITGGLHRTDCAANSEGGGSLSVAFDEACEAFNRAAEGLARELDAAETKS